MLALTQTAAWWFFPFVLPLCLYVAFTDMREMRITNQAVLALGALFLVLGLIALPFDEYLWRLLQLVIVLLAGMALNALGAMGAGDAKFLAAAAPYVALGDVRLVIALYLAVLLAAFAAHRLAKYSFLRNVAPHWQSWEQGKKFPMGLALGPSLALYLGLGLIYGS